MVKKVLVAGLGALLLSGLLFGRDAASYVSTSCGWVKQTVKDSVPIEFEIERARTMIRELDPEIRQNLHVIAREEVEVTRLRDQLADADKNLAKDRKEIARLKGDLDQGGSVFVYAGRSYNQRQVETDLTRRFDRFKTKEATAEKLRQILNARQTGLLAANDKLKGMQGAKRQLEVDVENLRARLEMVKVAETTGHFNFDDSRLSRTREAIQEISARIDVAEKLAHTSAAMPDQIKLEDEDSRNISEEVARYFADHPTTEEIVRLD
jgi:phage shock protein A